MNHERRILTTALLAGFPGVLVALLLLWVWGDYTPKVQWTLTVVILGTWLAFSFALRQRVAFPLQTLSNLLAALREGDYSIRARRAGGEDALGEVVLEVNALGEMLREQRLGALEATALLRKVMEEIDVAVFTFDSKQRLRLVNRGGERLLAQPAERLLGRSAAEIGVGACLGGREHAHRPDGFPGASGALGHASQHLSRRRLAAPVAGAVRFEPGAARRRAPSLAAPDPRPGP